MKKSLLALAFVAALPGCGCLRKKETKAPEKKSMDMKETAKASQKKSGKELMDVRSAY